MVPRAALGIHLRQKYKARLWMEQQGNTEQLAQAASSSSWR